jgi:hypothetical protein
MTSDHMTPAAQLADLSSVHETRPPNPIRRAEEMSMPPVPLQFLGYAPECAQCAVVDCQEHWHLPLPRAKPVDGADRRLRRFKADELKMIPEVAAVELVQHSRPGNRIRIWRSVNHVVIPMDIAFKGITPSGSSSSGKLIKGH